MSGFWQIFGGFQRAIDRGPGRVRVIEGFRYPVVRGLDADAVVGVGEHDRSGERGIHLADVLLEGTAHARLTMLMKAKMRVFQRSMTVRLKCRKCLAPAVPVSTTVVTPERKV